MKNFINKIALLFMSIGVLTIISCKEDDPEPNQLPDAVFSISDDSPEINQSLSFTDGSTDEDGEIVKWLWNFGDGDVAEDQNPTHTYNVAANYTIKLTVWDNRDGEDSFEMDIVVTDPVAENQVPTASFSKSASLVQKGEEVSFTDASSDSDGVISSWAWDFGDGNTSTSQNPKNFFGGTGTFTVSLTVTDNLGATATFTDEIKVWGTKWQFTSAGDFKQSTPAIADDGTLYIGSNDDNIYAINPDGTQKWAFLTGGNISTSPTIGPDGTVYCGSDDDFIYALNPADGTQKWAFNTGGNPNNTSAALETDGSVLYVGASSDKLFAINTADGTEKWQYAADGDILSIALGSNNVLYAIHNGTRNLVSINTADGAANWTYLHGAFAGGSMAIDESNAVYFQGDGDTDYIYAINADGTEKWKTQITGSASRGGVSIHDGKVYCATKEDTDNLRVHNITDGSAVWSYTAGGKFSAAPTIDADGNVYIGNEDDSFYVLDNTGALKYSFATGGNIWGSATIGSDGTVYFGSYDDNLYAMEFFVSAASTSTWPTLGKDTKNTNSK